MLIISVYDTGIGISEDNRKKLFKLFGKLEETASINTSGVGLGLSICKKIVEAFDGEIFIDDDYTSGAKFTFTISAKSEERFLNSPR